MCVCVCVLCARRMNLPGMSNALPPPPPRDTSGFERKLRSQSMETLMRSFDHKSSLDHRGEDLRAYANDQPSVRYSSIISSAMLQIHLALTRIRRKCPNRDFGNDIACLHWTRRFVGVRLIRHLNIVALLYSDISRTNGLVVKMSGPRAPEKKARLRTASLDRFFHNMAPDASEDSIPLDLPSIPPANRSSAHSMSLV